MANFVEKDCKLYVGGYNWSGDANALALEHGADVHDDTVMGDTTRSNFPGLKVVRAAADGFWEGGAVLDKIYFDAIGVTDTPFTMCPTTGAYGERAFFFKSMLAQYTPGAQIGSMMKFGVTAEGRGDLIKGNVLFPLSTVTSSGTSTGQVLGAVGAAEYLYAALHVFSVSASDTLDVVIQSDTSGFSSPLARVTFDQASAIGSQYASPVPGAITDTYWRISYTVTGDDPSISFAVVMGIQSGLNLVHSMAAGIGSYAVTGHAATLTES